MLEVKHICGQLKAMFMFKNEVFCSKGNSETSSDSVTGNSPLLLTVPFIVLLYSTSHSCIHCATTTQSPVPQSRQDKYHQPARTTAKPMSNKLIHHCHWEFSLRTPRHHLNDSVPGCCVWGICVIQVLSSISARYTRFLSPHSVPYPLSKSTLGLHTHTKPPTTP